jgi:hypothetical protein
VPSLELELVPSLELELMSSLLLELLTIPPLELELGRASLPPEDEEADRGASLLSLEHENVNTKASAMLAVKRKLGLVFIDSPLFESF